MTLKDMVREFHWTFNQPVLTTPRVPSKERLKLRLRLVDEEHREFREGIGFRRMSEDEWMSKCDLVETVDAIADLLYVLQGTALELGVDMDPVLREVHRSNMAKVWPDGKVHYDAFGKVKKPPGWKAPDIEGVLRAQGWDGR